MAKSLKRSHSVQTIDFLCAHFLTANVKNLLYEIKKTPKYNTPKQVNCHFLLFTRPQIFWGQTTKICPPQGIENVCPHFRRARFIAAGLIRMLSRCFLFPYKTTTNADVPSCVQLIASRNAWQRKASQVSPCGTSTFTPASWPQRSSSGVASARIPSAAGWLSAQLTTTVPGSSYFR